MLFLPIKTNTYEGGAWEQSTKAWEQSTKAWEQSTKLGCFGVGAKHESVVAKHELKTDRIDDEQH